jgi:hypothetical protein
MSAAFTKRCAACWIVCAAALTAGSPVCAGDLGDALDLRLRLQRHLAALLLDLGFLDRIDDRHRAVQRDQLGAQLLGGLLQRCLGGARFVLLRVADAAVVAEHAAHGAHRRPAA